MPLQIYMAERLCPLEQMADQVNDLLRAAGRAIVVISEGFDVGDLGRVLDAFDHQAFSSSRFTVAQAVVNYLNQVGLATKGMARSNIPGTDQRHSMAYASTVDLDEAYRVGQTALALAAGGQGGSMATILRQSGPVYSVRYGRGGQ
jgi:6-phosphofructokinase 1